REMTEDVQFAVDCAVPYPLFEFGLPALSGPQFENVRLAVGPRKATNHLAVVDHENFPVVDIIAAILANEIFHSIVIEYARD
ncbi:MAG: hypothetical protein ACI9G1_004291, partial [Pirellulaceae bacterium]